MRLLSLTLIMLGMSSAAMAGAEFHPSTYTTYMQHPPYKGYVKLLSDLPQDEASYTEIGMVRIDVDEVRGFDDAMDRLKAMAAQHGGMAIIPDDDARMMASGATPKNATATAVILNN